MHAQIKSEFMNYYCLISRLSIYFGILVNSNVVGFYLIVQFL